MLQCNTRAHDGLLAWWRLAGVHTSVADAPTPWLRASVGSPIPELAVRAIAPARPEPRAPLVEDPADARAELLAHTCDSPAALAAAVHEFVGQDAILYDGALESGLLFVVDAPCPADAARLLDGREGLLFDRMLAAIGRDRTRAAIATAALRPGTAPTPAFLRRLLALTRPRAIVALGGAATSILTGRPQGLNRLRGQWLETADGEAVLPTFHPAHLLQHPAHKALAWTDLLSLVTKFDT